MSESGAWKISFCPGISLFRVRKIPLLPFYIYMLSWLWYTGYNSILMAGWASSLTIDCWPVKGILKIRLRLVFRWKMILFIHKCKSTFQYNGSQELWYRKVDSFSKVHLDGPEQLEVDDGEESKWYEGHPQEVGDEDVVPGVRHVRSQTWRTDSGRHILHSLENCKCRHWSNFLWGHYLKVIECLQ